MADTGVEAAPVGAPPIGPTKGSEHRRLKVLKVINSLGTRFGGPSVSCVGAAIGEKRAGADTTLVFADSGDRANSSAPARRRLAAEEIPFIEFPLVPFVEPLLARLLGRDSSRWGVSLGLSWWLLRNHRKFDVIHVHGVWGLGATTVLALKRFAPWELVVTPHESLTRFDVETSSTAVTRVAKTLLRGLIARWTDLVVFSSELELVDSAMRSSVDQVVVPHAVVDERKLTLPSEPRTSVGMTFGFLGRFHPKKNLGLVIEALPQLPSHVTLVIAGGGSDEAERGVCRLIESSGVNERVELRGFLDAEQKDLFFREIDLLVMPSEYECFGMVAAEALAAGVPVVATPRVGLAPLVDLTGAGAVVRASSLDLVGALRLFVDDEQVRLDWTHSALRGAAHELTFGKYGHAILEAYRRNGDERLPAQARVPIG
jgi:glycosyltransferase involved in cell wall biosynthesis